MKSGSNPIRLDFTTGGKSHESEVKGWYYTFDHAMSQETLAGWVAALRSDEYEQIESCLCAIDHWNHSVEGYCCLGVLGSTMGFSNEQLSEEVVLSGSLSERTGMYETNGYGNGNEATCPRSLQDLFMAMNDEYGFTFPQIADWIEENLIKSSDEIRI